MKRTAEEVANTIEAFVSGTGNQWAWDGFISIRLDDPELEAIRKEVVDLPVQFPPANPKDYCSEAGMEKMKQIVADLRGRTITKYKIESTLQEASRPAKAPSTNIQAPEKLQASSSKQTSNAEPAFVPQSRDYGAAGR